MYITYVVTNICYIVTVYALDPNYAFIQIIPLYYLYPYTNYTNYGNYTNYANYFMQFMQFASYGAKIFCIF